MGIRRFVSSWCDVRPDEFSKVALLSVNFFLIIAAYYVIKTIRNSLVLHSLGADALPRIWLFTVVFLGVFVFLYGKLIDRIERQWVMTTSIAFFFVCLVIIQIFLTSDMPWVSGTLYVWGDVFSVVLVEQFWSLSNDIFDSSQAKRLYGIVGIGGTFGGMVSSAMVSKGAVLFGTANLIYLCHILLFLLVLSVFLIQRVSLGVRVIPEVSSHHDSSGGFGLILQSRYLSLIAVTLIIAQVVSTLIDFQFNKVVESAYAGLDDKTVFFGDFYVKLGTITILLALFVTAPVLRRLGLLGGLLVLPFVDVGGSALFLILPLPLIMEGLKLANKSVSYSVNRAAREILYIPTNRDVKYKAKAAIDMFCFRASKVIGSFLILALTGFLSVRYIGFVNVGLTIIAIIALVLIVRNYRVLERAIEPKF